MFKIRVSSFRSVVLILAAFLVISTIAGATEPCWDAGPLAIDETTRTLPGTAGESHCFALEVTRRGVVTIDLSRPDPASAAARLVLEGAGRTYVKRSATALVAVVEPGRYRVRVEAVDPRQALPEVKLRTAHVSFGDGFLKNEGDGEIEIDPDPLVVCPDDALALKDEGDGEIEIDPDPIPLLACTFDLAALSERLAALYPRLCRKGERDDHGDTLGCATALPADGVASGEIDNDWGDDEDVFSFRLDEPRVVEVGLSGAGLLAELYDRFGHRLAWSADEDGARVVQALSPGVYFVRVTGAGGAEGAYGLEVDSWR